MQGKIEYTNSDRNVHEMAIVTKSFDASTHEGRILVNNMDWAARSSSKHALAAGKPDIFALAERVIQADLCRLDSPLYVQNRDKKPCAFGLEVYRPFAILVDIKAGYASHRTTVFHNRRCQPGKS